MSANLIDTSAPAPAGVARARPAAGPALGGLRFDGLMAGLACWLIGGTFLDAWAHSHIPTLETFFTPWHAALYSGFAVVALALAATIVANHARGVPWRQAVPAGYGLALAGAAMVGTGGLADMTWHLAFGIERNLEAALSPTHLYLAAGICFLASGPLGAAWQRMEPPPIPWRAWVPRLLVLALILALVNVLTPFANPLVTFPATTPGYDDTQAGVTIAGILLQTGLLWGSLLLLMRRWTLPFGAFAFVFTIQTALLSVVRDAYMLIPAALLAGLGADVLYRAWQPGSAHPAALRRFAFAGPVLYYLLYFGTFQLTQGIGWSIHLWLGAAVLAGVVGVLLSFLAVPPAGPVADGAARGGGV